MANDPLSAEVELTCQHCGMVHKVQAVAAARMKVGDVPYKDPSNPEFGKCKRCRRKQMLVTKAPSTTSPVKLPGFWKPPTGGDSSDTTTESSGEPSE